MKFNLKQRYTIDKKSYYSFLKWARNYVLVNSCILIGILLIQRQMIHIQNETQFAFAEVVPKEEIVTEEMTVKEHVYKIMTEEYGLTFDEALEGLAIVRCESRFDPYALNKNADGSFDTGLWQINNRIHKDISRAETFDVYASTRWALQKYLDSGRSWRIWVCSR